MYPSCSQHVQLDWWPLTRDSIIVTISTTLLVVCVWDGRIEWYEAMLFSITYVLYFVVMFKNESLKRIAMHYIQNRWNLCGRLEPEPEDGTIDDKVPKKYNIAILGHAINGVLVGMDVESAKKLPPSSESSTSAPIEPVDPSRSNSSVESVKSVKWSELRISLASPEFRHYKRAVENSDHDINALIFLSYCKRCPMFSFLLCAYR